MIGKDKLKQVLIEQRTAILERPFGIKRQILGKIEEKSKLPHIIVLTGLRRSGKSTILRQIIKKQYNDSDFYYLNFEDERFFNFKASEFNEVYEALVELFGEKKTFFIDEIQNVPHFENFVRRFYDIGFKFFITGSNALLLSRELGTKLTGRHLDIVVEPFSFEEFLVSNGFNYSKDMLYKTKFRAKLKGYFSRYMKIGGMPEFVLYKDSDILRRVYEDIVAKDIFVRYNLEDIKQLKELYQYLITTFSQKFSYNSLRKFVGISSVNTIKKYIGYLEEVYLASVINKFDYSMKKQMINNKKLYIIDNAFIQIIATKTTNDKGWLLENLVFNNLRPKGKIFYYSEKHECDFIVIANKGIMEALQVSWELNEKNKEREINGLVEVMNKFKLKKGLILTYDQEEEIKKGGKIIKILPVWKWLLEKR